MEIYGIEFKTDYFNTSKARRHTVKCYGKPVKRAHVKDGIISYKFKSLCEFKKLYRIPIELGVTLIIGKTKKYDSSKSDAEI